MTRTHGDFIGVPNYTRRRYDAKGLVPPPAGAAMASDGRGIYPASLGNSVRYVHQGTGKPVLTTESGIAASDAALRQAYIPRSLQGLKAVMDEGVPVLGYTHWSLLDNFEWISGHGPQFGLVSVDRKSFARQAKPSARILGAIAQSGVLSWDNDL